MLTFGPCSSRIGRRKTFALMHLAALVMTPIVCWVPFYFNSYALMLCLLPIFGFFAQGIHAGYAVYFPELFPTHLRATGAGFCFNTLPSPRAASCKLSCAQVLATSRTLRPRKSGISIALRVEAA